MADTGRIITKQENTVWIRDASSFDPFTWGGACMMIEDIVKPGRALNPTYCQDPREGGVKITGTLQGLPTLPTSQLVMKETQYDTIADDLETCLWDFDRRTHCKDLDQWNAWEKIRRICYGSVTGVTHMGSDFGTGDDEESMITMPLTGRNAVTIRRTNAVLETEVESVAAPFYDVDVCHGERCGNRCDSEDKCVIAAVTGLVAAGESHLLVNNNGGKAGYWTDYALTEYDADNAIAVVCLGDYILIVGEGAADPQFARSYDGGATIGYLGGNADMAGNPVTQIDAVTQARVVACGQNGYIYVSDDGGDTWQTTDAGLANTDNYARIEIARENTDIVYVIGDLNAMAKSEDGGFTWVDVTGPSVGDNLTGLYVKDENNVLVGNDDGELWESSDGGTTWTAQVLPDDLTPVADTTVIQDIISCECNVLWLIVKTDNYLLSTDQMVYRNVDGGASGKWFAIGNHTLDGVSGPSTFEGIACCGVNKAIVVGGDTGATPITNFAATIS